MSGQPGRFARFALGVLGPALAVGCGVSPAGPRPPAPSAIGDDLVLVRAAHDPDRGAVLELCGSDRSMPIARVDGVALVLADRAAERALLPFAEWAVDGADLVVRCAARHDHLVELRFRVAAPGELHVSVEDRVGVRSEVLELGLEYEFLAGGPIDEAESPLVHPSTAQAAGDDTFRAPVAFLRRGGIALAITPDLDLLARNRRIPQALEIASAPEPWIRHGLCRLRPARDGGDLELMTRDGATPASVRGETLRFAHRVYLTDRATPRRTLSELHGRLWQRTAGRELARSAAPLVEETLDQLCSPVFARLASSNYREFRSGGAELATLSDASAGELERSWFTDRRHVLRAAQGIARFGTRTGSDELLRQTARVVDLALAAPRRGGLFPAVFSRDPGRGHASWQAGGGSYANDAFYLLDSAATGVELVEIADLLPDRREEILATCGELARFLAQNQSSYGQIPALFEASHLRPVHELPRGGRAETGGAALFLAEYARRSGDGDARAAAERALRFVATDVLPRAAWTDRATAEPRDTELDVDPARAAPRAALCLVLSARAAIALGKLEVATELLDELGYHQAVWTPPWRSDVVLGGFYDRNTRIADASPIDALAARALLEGYLATGRRECLQRGIAALRSGLLRPGPQVYGNRDTSAGVAEWAREVLGQGVVDVEQGFAEGIDAVWFEDVDVGYDRISFRLLSHAVFEQPVRIVFSGIASAEREYLITVNGETSGPFDSDALTRGLRLQPERTPRLEFCPPQRIRTESEWLPTARFTGPLPENALVRIELFDESGRIGALPLARGGDGELVAMEPFSTVDRVPGTEVLAHLVWEDAGRIVVDPPDGPRAIAIGSMDCIDPGDDLERALVSSQGSTVVRFADGRERARAVTGPSQSFTYAVPVDPSAAAVRLRLHLAGALRLSSDGVTLHEDRRDAVEAGVRVVETEVADPRLWSDGSLQLRFESAASTGSLEVACIEYLTVGRTSAIDPELARGARSRDPESRLGVLVVPIGLTDADCLVNAAELEQAFFGGTGYRRTPPPNPRVTAGSVRSLIAQLSGGITSLGGELAEKQDLDVSAAELSGAPATAAQTILGRIEPLLGEALRNAEIDVVAVIHGRDALPHGIDGEPLRRVGASGESVGIVFLPEQSADGSILSCGQAAIGLLRARYGLPRLDAREFGNFGELALSPSVAAHLPADLAGVQLVEAGWADEVEISPKPGARRIVLTPPMAGRRIYRLPFSSLVDRGDLMLEAREARNEGSDGRVLLYWRFDGARPYLVRVSGERVQPRYLRLSPQTPTLATPFSPGTSLDLFRQTSHLGGSSIPSIATLQGEELWTIDDLSPGDGRPSFVLRHVATDLLWQKDAPWYAGRDGWFGPLTRDGDDRGLGAVADLRGGCSFAIGPRAGTTLRGRFSLPAAPRSRRLFCQLTELEGDARATARIHVGGRTLLRTTIDASRGRATFQVDLPYVTDDEYLFVDIRCDRGRMLGRLSQLLVVPLAPTLHDVHLPRADSVARRLMDEVDYGSLHPIELDEDGVGTLSVPVLLPAGNIALRLHCGLARGDDAERAEVSLRLRSLDGEWKALALDRFVVQRRPERTPLPLVIAEVAPPAEARAAILDVEVRGEPGSALYLVSLAVVRP